MRRLDHSIHAARFFFAIALLVGGSPVMSIFWIATTRSLVEAMEV